jgi:hypothetical protein
LVVCRQKITAVDWWRVYRTKDQFIFALNNDVDGKGSDGSPHNHGQEAAGKFGAKYARRGYDIAIQTPAAKDFNEDLMSSRRTQTAEHAVSRNSVYNNEAGRGPAR